MYLIRLEYQNILSWLFKKHQFQSICVKVSLQIHFQQTHFTFGHPVVNMGVKLSKYDNLNYIHIQEIFFSTRFFFSSTVSQLNSTVEEI